MNPDLLSANLSLAFMAIIAAALLAHLSQLATRRRLLHGVYAATAAGLLYLFGEKALGWSFVPRDVLLAVYAALFVAVAGAALLRRGKGEDIPWIGLLIEQGAMAYIFAPGAYWKPPLAALLLLYFLLELFSWLKGREETRATAGASTDNRPPLYPPKRVRGAREMALAGAAAALAYVFAMGTGKVPAPPAPEEQANVEQQTAESPASDQTAPAENQAAEAPAPSEELKPAETAQAPEATTPPDAAPAEKPAAPEDTYTAKAGETLKTIARKLYGKADKLRALTAANPGIKPGAKLKAGQVIKLPEPPAK
ncbi:LysM peptidoglycan-binding domain-containing protein [Methylocystis iwaonis]|uniref:LysM peptidoglycan-binding domain-containing protein n=1 Tax=Methylocystis iwaonis TaxID=2885079 RepID=UPI002E7AD0C5|nr:LysM peptidoglycan-binding domain-containing protein [Methylocystis iwaonis]